MKKSIIVLLVVCVLGTLYAREVRRGPDIPRSQPGLAPPINVRLQSDGKIVALEKRVTVLEKQLIILCNLPPIQEALRKELLRKTKIRKDKQKDGNTLRVR